MTKTKPTPTLRTKAMKPRSIGRLSAKATAMPQATPAAKIPSPQSRLWRETRGRRGCSSRSSMPSGAGGGAAGRRRNMRGMVAQRD